MRRSKLTLLLTLIFILSLTSSVFAAEAPKPQIYGKAAISMDIETGEIIYENNIDAKEYPASTTKLLTALLLAENKTKTDMLTYTESAKKQPEYSFYNHYPKSIDVGVKLSGEGVMDSLLLFSANDIAYMIADNVSENSDEFAKLMNKKIQELGLKNTHFVTPNGLDDNTDDHYTTPYDLSVIGRHAFKNDWVREAMAKKTSKATTSTGVNFMLENRNKLVGENGCVGGKTGYTKKAGRCLVAFYDRDGRKIMGVVMNSVYGPNDTEVFDDMKKIIDWSYAAKQVVLTPKDKVVETKKISYKPLRFFGPEKTIEVPLTLKEDVKYYDNAVNKKDVSDPKNKIVKIDNLNIWKLDNSKSVGTLTVKEKEAVKTYKLYTTKSKSDIIKANTGLYIGLAAGVIIVLAVAIYLVLQIKRLTRKRKRY